MVELASNESCVSPSPAAVAAMIEAVKDTKRYPNYDCHELKQALAVHWGLDSDRFGVFNGSAEALPLLAEIFLEPGDEVIFCWPSFANYVVMTKLTGAVARSVPLRDFTFDLDGMADTVTSRPRWPSSATRTIPPDDRPR